MNRANYRHCFFYKIFNIKQTFSYLIILLETKMKLQEDYHDSNPEYNSNYAYPSSKEGSRKYHDDFREILAIKRERLQDALHFNQSELNQRRNKVLREKEREKLEADELKLKIENLIQTQHNREASKKISVQELLKKEYDDQINYHRNTKRREKQVDKQYAVKAEEVFDKQDKMRAKQLMRMYKPLRRGRADSNVLHFQANEPTRRHEDRSVDSYQRGSQSLPNIHKNNVENTNSRLNNQLQPRNSRLSSQQNQYDINVRLKNPQEIKQTRSINQIHNQTTQQKQYYQLDNPLKQPASSKKELKYFQNNMTEIPQPRSSVHLNQRQNTQIENYTPLNNNIDREIIQPRKEPYNLIGMKEPVSNYQDMKNSYKDYLQKQIQRKKNEKLREKEERLQREKSFLDQQRRQHETNLSRMRSQYLNQQKRYKDTLDYQLAERKLPSRDGLY